MEIFCVCRYDTRFLYWFIQGVRSVAISIKIEVKREFFVPAGIDTVFALLANVPESVSHFPKVAQLIDLGDNSYRWEMEKIGVDKHALQTVYACKYIANEAAKTITWEPVKGVGNGIVSGSWHLSEDGEGTHIAFQSEAEVSLPLPSILKLAISPVVKHEFNSLVEIYTDNLKKTLQAS